MLNFSLIQEESDNLSCDCHSSPEIICLVSLIACCLGLDCLRFLSNKKIRKISN